MLIINSVALEHQFFLENELFKFTLLSSFPQLYTERKKPVYATLRQLHVGIHR